MKSRSKLRSPFDRVGQMSILKTDAKLVESDPGVAIRSHLKPGARGAKYEALIEAIKMTLATGELLPGDQLPPEPELASKTGLSLGTVRRSLQRLAQQGIVSREHGRGTFVSSQTQSVDDLWHFRFIDSTDNSLIPVTPHVLERRLIKSTGEWSRALGESRSGFVRIRRLIDVDGRFSCHSSIYLSADIYAPLLEVSSTQIERFGLKNVIAERFHVPTLSAAKTTRCVSVPRIVSRTLNIDKNDRVLLIEIVAKSFNESPISYHALHVPPDAAPLDVWTTPSSKSFEKGQLR